MRVCIAHKDPAVITLRNMADNAEYDLCQVCFDAILPVLTGEQERPQRKINPRTDKK